MTHKRKTIRDAVVALLDVGTIVATGKVYSNRALNVWAADLPVLNVYAKEERSDPLDLSTKRLSRALTLTVEGVATAVDDSSLDDALDDMAELIETALKADSSWNGAVFDSTLTGTTIEVEREGETALGRIQLTYDVRYHY